MKKILFILTFFLILTNLIASGQRQDSISFNATPNPFDSVTKFSFYISSADTVTIRIYNVVGQMVATIFLKEYFSQGNHDTICNLNPLPVGIYFAFLFVGDTSIGAKLIKLTNNSYVQEKTDKRNQISIYPNPSTTQLTIETNNLTKENIFTILNVNGQELVRQQIKESKTQIDISNLTSGIYFVKLISDKTVEVRKIIKE